MITLENVHWEPYDDVVLSDISLTIYPGEFVCVTGPIASGKTPLMRIMAGVEEPTRGTVAFDGVVLQNVPTSLRPLLRKRVAYVSGSPPLQSDFSVAESIAYPLRLWDSNESEVCRRLSWLCYHLGLSDCLNESVSSLPHGKQILTAVARSLVLNPLIIMLDEPWSALSIDEMTRLTEVLSIFHSQSATIICNCDRALIPYQVPVRVLELERGSIHCDSKTPLLTAAEVSDLQEKEQTEGRRHLDRIIEKAMDQVVGKKQKNRIPIAAKRA